MRLLYSEHDIHRYVDYAFKAIQPRQMTSDRLYPLTEYLPDSIVDRMDNEPRADLDEMGRCVQLSTLTGEALWTAAALMAFRVFEDAARTIVAADLKLNASKMHLNEVLERLEEEVFSEAFVDDLHELRWLRNEGMHSERRFGRKAALKIVRLALLVAVYAYCLAT